MTQLLDLLFGSADAASAASCLACDPRLLGLRGFTDATTAYLAIPAAVLVFLLRRHDLPPAAGPVDGLLIAVVLVGSLTHLMSVVTLWTPAYGAQGTVQDVTAAVSLGITIPVWPQLAKLLGLPSRRDLARSNQALARANASLETTIASRTHEFERANERFEMALSRSNITVFTQDRALRYTWVHNPRPGLTPADADAEAPPDDPAAVETEMKREVLATGHTASQVVSVTSRTQGVRHFDLTVSPTRDQAGAIDGVLCTGVDVTESRLFEVRVAAMAAEVATAYRRFELALENSPVTVFEQDRDLRYSFIHNPPPGLAAEDFLGRTDAEVMPQADQSKLISARQRVLETSRREALEFESEVAGLVRFFELRLEPKTGTSGEVEGIIGTALDLTERRRNERQMRLVMRELTHRSKNLLAVVQAIARKTASMAPDVDTFIRDFSSRLRAIAASHDLLVAESWSGAELHDLLTASLAQTVDPKAPEIHIQGSPLKLSPDAAQTLGLAFHELTMNAATHGALSVPGGELSVAWQHADGQVSLDWREAGGPTVSKPSRNGFGRVLLERLVGTSLNGAVSLDFRPEGLLCRITFPDDRLIAAA